MHMQNLWEWIRMISKEKIMEEKVGLRSLILEKFSKELLTEVLPALTGATAKKLIEWGIIYEFAS